jgi:microcystin-dependent protein
VARASSAVATAPIPNGAVLAKANNLYHSPAGSSLVALHPQTLADVPGNASHENMQPFLVLNYVIALQGLFPSRP